MKELDRSRKRKWASVIAASVILLGALALTTMFSTAGTQNWGGKYPRVIDRESVAFGRTYSEWSAAWEQWADSIPTANHPLFDNGLISFGQTGPVWFLGGKFCAVGNTNCGTTNVVRFGDIPAGTALYVAVFNSEDSTLENPLKQQINDLRAAVQGGIDPATVSMEVDGVSIHDLKDDFRVQSPAFAFTIPDDNFFKALGEGDFKAGSYFPGVDDGVYVMLAPLPLGLHTIHFRGSNPFFTLDITYHLHVKP